MTDLRHLIDKAIFIHIIIQIFKVCPNSFLLHRHKKKEKKQKDTAVPIKAV